VHRTACLHFQFVNCGANILVVTGFTFGTTNRYWQTEEPLSVMSKSTGGIADHSAGNPATLGTLGAIPRIESDDRETIRRITHLMNRG